jgi:hypothetical protein
MITPSSLERGAWLIALGGLSATIGLETDWGQRLTASAPPATEVVSDYQEPVLVAPFQLPSPDQYLETSLRPLFISARRPAPSLAVAEPPKPAMKKDQFTLTGTTIVPEGKFAFLLEKAINKVHVLTEGKEIYGLRVAEVLAERVTLTQYDESEVLILKSAKSSSAPAAPMPAGAAPIAPRPPLPAAFPVPPQPVTATPANPPTPGGQQPRPDYNSRRPPGGGQSGTRFGP